MSVRKPRHFTYYERMKSSFEMVQEKTAKSLCNYLLNFIENCVGETRPEVLDFTDKRTEEKISQFLLANRDFFAQLLDNYLEFSSQKEAHVGKDSNKSRILAKTIEKHCYQILCLSALYSPPELQQIYVTKLSSFLIKHGRDTPFGPFELTVWTTLNLLINPVKLKQQCDGSVEMFTHFTKALGKQSGASSQPADSTAKSWANPSLHGTVLLALGVSIKYARNSLGLRIPHEFDEIEFVDDAIKNMALEFIHAYIVQMPYLCDYSFSVDVLDSILKNFICYFPDKLVEIYNLCEEELYSFLEEDGGGGIPSLFGQSSQRRNEAKRLNFANLSFKTLLELIATLYESESPQLTQLSKEFTDPKCDALCDFIYKGRAISAPPLKIAYLSKLKSLCKSSQSAGVFFGIFK